MPLRRRPARVLEHRRARPRRRAVGGGAVRGRGHPGRPRARTATTVGPRGGHTSGRRSRTTPSSSAAGTRHRTRSVHVGAARGGAGRSRSSTTATSPGGPRSTTATPRSTRRPCTGARCCWTGPRAASTSSTRSPAGRRGAGSSAFHSGPAVAGRRLADSVRRGRWAWPGPAPAGAARGWSCRRRSSGACTAARPSPILGWYSPGLGRRVPAFTLLGCGRCKAGTPLATRLEFVEIACPDDPRPVVVRTRHPGDQMSQTGRGLRRPVQLVRRHGSWWASWRPWASSSAAATPRSIRSR